MFGEEGPEGLVLALARVERIEEEAFFRCYRNPNPMSLTR